MDRKDGQEMMERKGWTGEDELGTGWKGEDVKVGKDSMNRTGWIGLWTGKEGQDRKDKTGRTGQDGQEGWTGSMDRNMMDMAGWSGRMDRGGWKGQDGHDRTEQERMDRTG